jgi:hypothetical protein
MQWITNIGLNLHASGPAAVLIVWLICFTALALYGSGEAAHTGLGVLGAFGGVLIAALGHRT